MYKTNIPSKLSREEFISIFGSVYEHSPWIAAQLYDAGIEQTFNNCQSLHVAMKTIVDNADRKQKLKLLNSHPDLAGKLAVNEVLTPSSAFEQTGAGLNNCSQDEFDEFQKLNKKYKAKFGFPFILSVSGYQRKEILEIFRERVNNEKTIEFAEALEQVHCIAMFRLENIE